MTSQKLLQELITRSEHKIALCEEQLLYLSTESLLYKENDSQWNALECLEHLHRYAKFYHSSIDEKLKQSVFPDDLNYKESWMGKQFMKMFDETKAKKYSTLKRMNPQHATIQKEAVTRFIEEQMYFINLLKRAQNHSLHKNKVPLEFFKLLSLPLGDLFRFLSAHDERHLMQAIRISKIHHSRS